MSSWVVVTKRLLSDGNEAMVVPAIANLTRPSKVKRIVYLLSDVFYYAARYVVVSYIF
jgi:hypothetical protein